MDGFNPILIGATLALAASAVGVMAILKGAARAQFVYAQLCVMAGIYVGFALTGLDGRDFISRADWSAFMVESVLALGFIFAGLAVLGSHRPWLLGALIFAHGATDVFHLIIEGSIAPAWYAFACILYDAIVGAAAIIMLSAQGPQKP